MRARTRSTTTLLWALALAACESAASTEPSGVDASADAAVSSDAGAADSSSPDVATEPTPDAGVVDPWNPPLEGPVDGLDTFEGWETPRILPAPVNVDGGWTDSVALAADGRHALFAYSTYDFFSLYSKRTFVVSGARRPGMTVDDFRIFEAVLTPSGYTVAAHPIGNGDPNLAQASATLNATRDLLLFTQWAHDAGFVGDLYFSGYANGWTTPQPLAVNSPCNEDNAFVVGSVVNGARVYFESDRIDDLGTSCGTTRHIFSSDFKMDAGFSAPKRVAGMNATGPNDRDEQPWISADEKTAIWTRASESPAFYGVVTADRATTADPFSNVRPLFAPRTHAPPFAGKVVLVGEANVAEVAQGWIMLMMCGIAGDDSDANAGPNDIRLRVCFSRKPR